MLGRQVNRSLLYSQDSNEQWGDGIAWGGGGSKISLNETQPGVFKGAKMNESEKKSPNINEENSNFGPNMGKVSE